LRDEEHRNPRHDAVSLRRWRDLRLSARLRDPLPSERRPARSGRRRRLGSSRPPAGHWLSGALFTHDRLGALFTDDRLGALLADDPGWFPCRLTLLPFSRPKCVSGLSRAHQVPGWVLPRRPDASGRASSTTRHHDRSANRSSLLGPTTHEPRNRRTTPLGERNTDAGRRSRSALHHRNRAAGPITWAREVAWTPLGGPVVPRVRP